MNIKCPNCGSTAQVKPIDKNVNKSYSIQIVNKYACGCGCEFKVAYEIIKNKY